MICVVAPWTIPMVPVPISLGSLAVYVAASVIDKKHGTAAVLVYVALGAFGVPVFTGFSGGFGKVAGVTGGYIVGYIVCALIVGLIVDALEKRAWAYPLAMFAGTLALYAFGTAWYMIQSGAGFAAALLGCVVPFLIGDTIKIVAASALCFRLRFLLKKLVLSEPRRKKNKPAEATPQSPSDGKSD